MDSDGLKPRNYAQRRRKNLRKDAYLFDAECINCIGMVQQEQWKAAAARFTRNVVRTALRCGLSVPEGTLALWGTGPENARSNYLRRQQEQATAARNRERKTADAGETRKRDARLGETVFLFDQEFNRGLAGG